MEQERSSSDGVSRSGKKRVVGSASRPPAPSEPAPRRSHPDPAQQSQSLSHQLVGHEHVPARKNLGPIMLSAADKRESLQTSVGHVPGNVQEVLKKPDARHRAGHHVPLSPKSRPHDRRHGKLTHGASVQPERRTEQSEDHMPRFMEDKIDVVKKDESVLISPEQEEEPG